MSLYTVKGKIEKDGKTYELRQTDATTVRRVEVESVTHQPPTPSPSDEKKKKTTKKKVARKKVTKKKKAAKK